MSERECHITSLIVHGRPEHRESLKSTLASIEGAEIAGADAYGKFIVILETDTLYQVTDTINAITQLEGVINAVLVFHQIEQTNRLDDLVEITMPSPESVQPEEVTS